jgi:uncharacterized protein YceH (UPF0502 family)
MTMDILLAPEQIRLLGALLEKEVTTPDYYPMTLNSLVHACNQKSCRDPVTAYDEGTVALHLDALRDEHRLAALVAVADSRVAKFKQRLTELYTFSPAERAVLCELLLRGPQTPGELRNRGERMHAFASLEEVQAALKELESRPDGPWVMVLPRQPGRKEARYAHLLGGPPVAGDEEAVEAVSGPGPVNSPTERIARLEAEVERLNGELAALREAFDGFRGQFG